MPGGDLTLVYAIPISLSCTMCLVLINKCLHDNTVNILMLAFICDHDSALRQMLCPSTASQRS